MTTVAQLRTWFDIGVAEKASYMIVVCDTYNHTDYPVFYGEVGLSDKINYYHHKNMQEVMAVYRLNEDREKQLALPCAGRDLINKGIENETVTV